MNPLVSLYLQLIVRWVHVIAGVMWVGNLWFFNFVNAQFVKGLDAATKAQVLPALMPRILYFFRFAALYSWSTGFLLLGMAYYGGGVLVPPEGGRFHNGATAGIAVASLLVAWVVYDLLWKSIPDERLAAGVSFLLIAGYAFGMSRIVLGKAMVIHVGAAFGTIMLCNVWMRIWPAQRKIIGALQGANPAPEPGVAVSAALRSKHNTYLSFPLLFMMTMNHFPTIYGNDLAWLFVAAFVLVGWGLARVLYWKANSAAPASL
jgi:uncharacterized membrane protein